MSKVIDLELDLPPSVEQIVDYFKDTVLRRSEKGLVSLVEATPEGFRLKGRFSQPQRTRRSTWARPVVSGGRLFLRDQHLLFCYDLREGSLDEEPEKEEASPRRRTRGPPRED